MSIVAVTTYQIRLHLLDSFLRDGETKFFLGDGKIEPKLTPGEKSVLARGFESTIDATVKQLTEGENRWAISLLA